MGISSHPVELVVDGSILQLSNGALHVYNVLGDHNAPVCSGIEGMMVDFDDRGGIFRGNV